MSKAQSQLDKAVPNCFTRPAPFSTELAKISNILNSVDTGWLHHKYDSCILIWPLFRMILYYIMQNQANKNHGPQP